MRILGIIRDNTGGNHFRVEQPLSKLQEHNLADVILLEQWELGTDYAVEKMLECDIIFFHRPCDKAWFDFMKLAQQYGKIVVVDYDDDPFNTSPWNPYYKVIGTKEWAFKWPDGTVDEVWKNGVDGFDIEQNIIRRDMFRACFSKADLLTVSCPLLAETFKDLNKNIKVIPNLMDPKRFPEGQMMKTDEIRIGWQGGYSHYEDLAMIKDDLIKITKEHKNAKLVFLGDTGHRNLFAKDVKPEQMEWHPWVPNVAYELKLKCLNLDIGLCPLVDNEFNRKKTAIKWMEYAMTGAATIASNIPPYSDHIKHNRTGYLCEPDGWFEAIDYLIKNKRNRFKMWEFARDRVLDEHNADKNAHILADALKALMKRDLKTELAVA